MNAGNNFAETIKTPMELHFDIIQAFSMEDCHGFSSTVFLFIFLPLTLAGYYLIDRRFKNAFLLLASLLFYAWGE